MKQTDLEKSIIKKYRKDIWARFVKGINDYDMIKENDKIVGTVLGIVCHSIPLIGMPFMVVEDVVVKSEYRKKGIGKKLFDEIDRIALENNCGYSFLVSGERRKVAHIFYDKQGYNEPVKGFRKKYIK